VKTKISLITRRLSDGEESLAEC